METIITSQSETELATYINATCGNKSAFITVYKGALSGVRVLCLNASHRTWKTGAGKFFETAESAVTGFKSGEMRAMISAALSSSLSLV